MPDPVPPPEERAHVEALAEDLRAELEALKLRAALLGEAVEEDAPATVGSR